MPVTSANVLIGAATVSIADWVTNPGGASPTYADIGHTSAPVTLTSERENVDVEAETAFGVVQTRVIRQAYTLVVPYLESTVENMRAVLSQAAAQKTGTTPNFTLAVIDPSTTVGDLYKIVKVVVPGLGTNGLATYTFWKCMPSAIEAIPFAKAEPQKYTVTFKVVRDDSNSTANGYYFRRTDS